MNEMFVSSLEIANSIFSVMISVDAQAFRQSKARQRLNKYVTMDFYNLNDEMKCYHLDEVKALLEVIADEFSTLDHNVSHQEFFRLKHHVKVVEAVCGDVSEKYECFSSAS